MENERMLAIKRLSKSFGKKEALKDVNLLLNRGEVVGLLGPNGAGKSTLIKCIVGLLRPTLGEIKISDHPRISKEARRITAYVPELPQLYDMLSVWEHLQFITQAYEVTNWEDRAEQMLEMFDLMEQKDEIAKNLSKGMRQKLSLTCGVMSGAHFFLMDEPMIGLDPKAIRNLKSLISQLKDEGKTLLISTHLLDPIENICDRIIVLKKGEIIADGSLDFLRQKLGGENASLEEVFLEVTADA